MATTDYLRGTGTAADPYIIHNAAAWAQFFCNDREAGYFFEVVADIDCGGVTLVKSTGYFAGTLNGNGHHVSNFKCASGFWLNTGPYLTNGKVNDLWLTATLTGGSAAFWHQAGYMVLIAKNCRFDITATTTTLCMFWQLTSTAYIENCIFNLYGSSPKFAYSASAAPATMYAIMDASAKINAPGAVILSRSGAVNPSIYSTLDYAKWVIDGIDIPSLIPYGRDDLTIGYVVKGVTKVGGIGKPRQLLAMSAAYLGVIKQLKTGEDGSYTLGLNDYYDPLLICHYDDYGYPFQPNTAKTLGARIHPAIPNGYAYECTSAGTTDNAAPTDWPTTGTLTSGTAIFTPKPIYAPETLLVVPRLINLLTGEPVEV